MRTETFAVEFCYSLMNLNAEVVKQTMSLGEI